MPRARDRGRNGRVEARRREERQEGKPTFMGALTYARHAGATGLAHGGHVQHLTLK